MSIRRQSSSWPRTRTRLGRRQRRLKRCARRAGDAHLYPDGGGFYLCKAIAARLGLAPENIILGNGSNEVIEFLGHAFLNLDDDVITSEYAFIVYKLITTSFGAQLIETPTPDFQQDVDAMLDAITPKTRFIFIPNPNNPTGTLISQRNIDSFMSRVPENIIVVFDEAYFEFLDDPPDTLQYVREGRNVVVLRTFSKIHGLAGLRIGYGMARPDLIEVLHKTRQPFNVNSIAHAGALAALNDDAHQRETKRVVDQGRAYLQEQFAEMKLQFVPGVANFVMVKCRRRAVPSSKSCWHGRSSCDRSKATIWPEWVRISVGTMEQNKKCIAALKEILGTSTDLTAGKERMIAGETIAAISTPAGEGAIALVRVSGVDAIAVADKIFLGKEKPSRFASHVQHFGEILDGADRLIDQVMLSIHRAPASYTGEDLVEISCHGGALVSAKVLEACLRAGARAARPGEFTERAFLNGKMDLTQAEAVIDLIRAKTDLALRSATEQLEGQARREDQENSR